MKDQLNKKRANLRDVAKAAGVSVATVSRVLNSPQVVSEITRTKVQTAIEALSFVPSAAARAINSGRTRVVGALVPTLDNAIFARFLAALEYELGLHGLSLVVATTGDSPKIEAQKAQGLIDIGAEALIVSGVTHCVELDNLIAHTQLPTIATSYYSQDYHLPTIGYNNAAAAQMALRHLVSEGHVDIAVIHGPSLNNDRTRHRLAGLDELSANLHLIKFETEVSIEGGAIAMKSLLSQKASFTAALCLSDVLAIGALFELQRNGISVPDAISLIGIDDLPQSAQTVPSLTTVHLPVSRMGHLTALAIVDWLENHTVPASNLLEAQLVKRQSTRSVV